MEVDYVEEGDSSQEKPHDSSSAPVAVGRDALGFNVAEVEDDAGVEFVFEVLV